MATSSFSRRVTDWFAHSGRHDLPWQKNKTPYRVWVSEIMLQQTQTKTVIPYFKRFIKRFPSVKQLANAELDEILQYWAGLGYYSRARYLHEAAQIVNKEFHNRVPRDITTLMSLPGIGKSTAGAILALCHNQRVPILDGNVKRVLTRHQDIAGWPGKSSVNKQLWILAEKLLPKTHVAEYTQGLMDLGATICTRDNPHCNQCPVSNDCKARIANTIHQRPERMSPKIKPSRAVTMLIITHQNQVLLQRRPPQGIWAGLLCFPEVSVPEQAEIWCRNALGIDNATHAWQPISHSFTHFTLNITPVHIPLDGAPVTVKEKDGYVWCRIYAQLAVPAPVKRLLATINKTE